MQAPPPPVGWLPSSTLVPPSGVTSGEASVLPPIPSLTDRHAASTQAEECKEEAGTDCAPTTPLPIPGAGDTSFRRQRRDERGSGAKKHKTCRECRDTYEADRSDRSNLCEVCREFVRERCVHCQEQHTVSCRTTPSKPLHTPQGCGCLL